MDYDMPVINSQPSPFGHLTRERHIQSTARPVGKKQSSLEILARGASHGHAGALLAEESHSTGSQNQSSLAALTQGSRDHHSRTEAWTCSEGGPPGRRCQAALDWHAVPSGCKRKEGEELRPTGSPETSRHSQLGILVASNQFFITSKVERHGPVRNLQRRAYLINGPTGRGLLKATEDYNACCFQLCGPARSSHLCIQDQDGDVILWFFRPFRLGLGCLPRCEMEMKVFSRDNQLIGTVHQRGCISNLLEVRNSQGLTTMEIQGSCLTSRCFSEQEFQALSPTGDVVATIWKAWPGFKEEHNMDHEFFGVDIVGTDLREEERACLLAAAFLLNFMFFEMS